MNDKYTGENLILIISQPRSGSTLLQRILSGHTEIQTSAETWLMLYPAYAFKNTGLKSEFNMRWTKQAIDEFLNNYTEGDFTYIEAWRNWADTIYNAALQKSGKKFFIDKTPRYFFIIPELFKLLPNATFIFLLRNPLAVLASELSTYVKEDWDVLSLFNPDLIQAPKLILEGIELLKDKAITIHYEELVQYPEENIARLCLQLGIKFNKDMLNYDDTPQPKGAMNDHIGIVQHTRPSMSSLDKWKILTKSDQTKHFAHEYLNSLGETTVEKLGYSFQELKNTLGNDDNFIKNSRTIFPWNIAIEPKKTRTLKQQYIADRYYAIRDKDSVFLGTLSNFKMYLIKFFKFIRKNS